MAVKLLNKIEAAASANISLRNLDRMIAEGRGPRVTRIGARVLFAETDLDAWLLAHAAPDGQPHDQPSITAAA